MIVKIVQRSLFAQLAKRTVVVLASAFHRSSTHLEPPWTTSGPPLPWPPPAAAAMARAVLPGCPTPHCRAHGFLAPVNSKQELPLPPLGAAALARAVAAEPSPLRSLCPPPPWPPSKSPPRPPQPVPAAPASALSFRALSSKSPPDLVWCLAKDNCVLVSAALRDH